jgi:hypothetical protein
MYALGAELFLKEYNKKKNKKKKYKKSCMVAQLVPPVVFVTHKYKKL